MVVGDSKEKMIIFRDKQNLPIIYRLFVKFSNVMKIYILNIRMVVHDWERKEYKNLLKFFSVVK